MPDPVRSDAALFAPLLELLADEALVHAVRETGATGLEPATSGVTGLTKPLRRAFA